MRILFVAMANSIHTARWISQIGQRGWDIHLFPVRDPVGGDSPPHRELRNLTLHDAIISHASGLDLSVRSISRLWPLLRTTWLFPRGATRMQGKRVKWFPSWGDRARRLAYAIRRIRPDIIHSLEFQHSAYLTLEARHQMDGDFPPWIVSAWGSDIYLFGRLPDHVERIRAVLFACDYFTSDCHRDIALARSFDFKGQVLPVFPAGGGYDIERARQLQRSAPPSARRVIMLKGYQGWAGRALVGLRAIELCADQLKGYRVGVYMAGPDTTIASQLLGHSTGISFEIIPPSSHEDILRWHGRARVSIGLGISDGIPQSVLEAMIMGSFPIQSHTSCTDEWLRCGATGFLVPPEDPEAVAHAIRRAISDDELVDRAAKLNAEVAADRLDHSVIGPRVVEMYERVAARGLPRAGAVHPQLA